jgi:hypothetical protein
MVVVAPNAITVGAPKNPIISHRRNQFCCVPTATINFCYFPRGQYLYSPPIGHLWIFPTPSSEIMITNNLINTQHVKTSVIKSRILYIQSAMTHPEITS